MGYSCRADAWETLQAIQNQLPSKSNYWEHEGKKYFLEIGKETKDGSITGTVFEDKKGQCVKAGSLKITGWGEIVRFPGLPKIVRERAKQRF